MKGIAVISSQAGSLVNFRGELIKEFAARNIKVFAFAPDFAPATRSQVEALGAIPVDYHLSRTGMNPVRDLRSLVSLFSALKRLKPDGCFAYTIKPVIYGTLAAWAAGVGRRFALISGLGYVFTESESGSSFKRKILRRMVIVLYKSALAMAEKVFFQNTDDLSLFVNWRIVGNGKAVRVNGSGVNIERWRPVSPVIKPVTFLMAARLLREKGIVEYAEACRMIKAKHPNVRTIILGDLDTNPGALSREIVEGWKNEGILEWPGHVDVVPWYSQASVFVLPSYREGVPRSTQEAMAMGRAVITTDAPGCRETVIDGVNGFLVPVRSAAGLAEAMEKFIHQPQLITIMGGASRRLAEERFDVKLVNKEIILAMGIK